MKLIPICIGVRPCKDHHHIRPALEQLRRIVDRQVIPGAVEPLLGGIIVDDEANSDLYRRTSMQGSPPHPAGARAAATNRRPAGDTRGCRAPAWRDYRRR